MQKPLTRIFVRDILDIVEGGIEMKEIFKSKAMVAFLIMLIGFFYLNAKDIQKMEVTENTSENPYIALNA